MNDWMLMLASAAAASLIAYGELSAMNREVPAQGEVTAAAPAVAAPVRDPGPVAGNGANDQTIGATGQAGMPRGR